MQVSSMSKRSAALGADDGKLGDSSRTNYIVINKIHNLLVLEAIFLLICIVGVTFLAWLFAIHSNKSEVIDKKIHELENNLQQFQSISKSNNECMVYHNFVSKFEHKQDIQQILDKCSSNFLSWFTSEQKIKAIVDAALTKYDSDNTALADYALESVGGTVITEFSSKTYTSRSSTLNILGLPILKRVPSPNIILRKGLTPGNCWPMTGSQGYVLISLAFPVSPMMFTLEHLPKSLSFDGQSRSAPKEFSIQGLRSMDHVGEFLGRFTYDTTRIDSSHIQTFHVQSRNHSSFFRLIKLIIQSNWGHPEFTCIYRFRVHGQAQLPASY